MTRATEHRLAPAARFKSDESAAMVRYSGSRANVTAGSSTSAATLLPAGAKVIEVRATDSIYLRFGASDVAAAAADANNILFLGGEKVMVVPDDATHFRAIRVGSADVAVQIEKVEVE